MISSLSNHLICSHLNVDIFQICLFTHPLPIYILTRVYLQGSSTMFSPSHYEEWVIGIRGSRFWASEMKISISYGWFMHVWISEVGRDFIWVQIVKNSFTSTDLLFLSSTLTLFKSKGWRVEKRGAERRGRRVLFFGTKTFPSKEESLLLL